MMEFLSNNKDLILIISVVVLFINALLVGLYTALGIIKDYTVTDSDNKVHAFLGSAIDFLKKFVELAAARLEKRDQPK